MDNTDTDLISKKVYCSRKRVIQFTKNGFAHIIEFPTKPSNLNIEDTKSAHVLITYYIHTIA